MNYPKDWSETHPEAEAMLYEPADLARPSPSSMAIGLLVGFGGLCCILATAILLRWV